MSFDIEVKGLDETIRALNELSEGLTAKGLQLWVEKIESDAKNLAAGKISYEIKESINVNVEEKEGNPQISAKAKPEAFPFI